jgi:hypothetical protein
MNGPFPCQQLAPIVTEINRSHKVCAEKTAAAVTGPRRGGKVIFYFVMTSSYAIVELCAKKPGSRVSLSIATY